MVEKGVKKHTDNSDRLFQENSAPIGWGFVINPNISWIRRFMWLFIMISGTTYSIFNIQKNAMTYLSYPTFVENLVSNEETARFPQITMCPNSMHSNIRISTNYPTLNMELLQQLYTGNETFFEDYENQTAVNELKKVDYEQFLHRTRSVMMVTGCRSYIAVKEDSKCQADWTVRYTRYGHCQMFNPDKDKFTKKMVYGRWATMSFSIVYNDSDHDIGWFPFLSGLTLFYSDAYEDTIDPLYSVTVPPGDGPLVAFNQVHNTLLGPPYSECIHQKDHNLKYYSNYTIDHCLHECIVDKLIHECDCVPGYLESRPLNRTQMTINKNVWMDETNYTGEIDDVPDYPIFETGRNESFNARGSAAKSCSLYDHATCVSVIIRNFNYTSCKSCNDSCDSVTQEASLIQYGKYKYAKTLSDMSGKPVDHIQSGVIYLAETRETQRIETEKYSGAAFFSDIGGHAGLILGISVTTLLGIIDYIMTKSWFWFRHNFGRKPKKDEEVTTDCPEKLNNGTIDK